MDYVATGRYTDSRGRSHNFKITTDTANSSYIKELVEARYPTKGTIYVHEIKRA